MIADSLAGAVGRVLGSDPAHPLDFWVGVAEDQYLQLDDIIAVTTPVPGRGEIAVYGIVDVVRARYEGARFDSDVFRVAEGVLPVGIATAAHVSVTRIEPEIFVPPAPGQPVYRATGAQREQALYFDNMERRFAVGLSRENEPIWGNLEFLDGTRGAHVNISGVSGVATKTSYALFLLYSLFHSDVLGMQKHRAHAVVFNVKGEDLMFADKPNRRLQAEETQKYESLGLPCGPFQDVSLWAPATTEPFAIVHSLAARQEGVTPYVWSLREFCQSGLLRFLFAEADTETSQLSFAVTVVERYLAEKTAGQPKSQSGVEIDGVHLNDFRDLVDHVNANRDAIFVPSHVAQATQEAFLRRLEAADHTVGHLIRKLSSEEEERRYRIDWQARQLNVIDINSLHDRAKRFVVGVVLNSLLEAKDNPSAGRSLTFVVLDELNKYAPREGWSPIKEVLLDIAERGRSLGVVLIGAQQTASEVERRVVANASFRVVGRLDTAEAERSEYGFLTQAARERASLLKPGTMFLHQPEIPVPLITQFPFPSWATRPDEVAAPTEVPKGFRA
ncbi:MAG TPA: ATP-binding protein [Dehalococcoidia bacterium]|nr:ATP-binding protein [Dehalococcoidia bacterium]